MCAVNQKRPSFLTVGPFLDLLPFDLSHLRGPLREDPLLKAPYTQARPLREGPLQGGAVLTGSFWGWPLTGKFPKRALPYGEGRSYGQTALREGPLRGGLLREGPRLLTGRPLRGRLLTGLREATGRDFTRIGLLRLDRFGLCPLRDLSPLQGPLRADRLTGMPLTGRLRTGRPLTNYRKAYGKLWEGLYQNWAGISACVP